MRYCINPDCQQRQSPDNLQKCKACGNNLLIKDRYWLVEHLRPLGTPYFDVFEADDHGTAKVLKVLKTNQHKKYTELFEQEARILTNLSHPGIPKAEPDGRFLWKLNNGRELPCLVMEKIEGQNLEQWLQQNQQITQNYQALDWLRKITAILDYLHSKDFFHRDIKPSNIMLKPDDQLVLIDFGTAREITETVINGQTVTAVCSSGYTAPEQIKGNAVKQSDFFALGRTFVHLLTGKHPDSLSLNRQTKQLIWHHSLALEISQQLADFIDELMAPEVKNRPYNTRIILQRLEKIGRSLPQQDISTVPSPPPSPLYGWFTTLRLPIILLVGVCIGLIIPQLLSSIVLPSQRACDSPRLDVSQMAFSPDGKYLAMASLDKTVRVLEATDGNKQVGCDSKSHTDGIVALKFSPDATKIATASLDATARLWTINNDGIINSEKRLSHERRTPEGQEYKPALVAVDFSRDGKFLATASADGFAKVWDTTNGKQVASLNNKTYVRAISFSQDGKYLATASLNNQARVWEWQADKKGEKAIPLPQNDVVAVDFSPIDPRYLATASGEGIIQIWDTTTLKPVATAEIKTYPTYISFSPDGKHLVAIGLEDNQAVLWEWQANPKGEIRIPLIHDKDDNVVAVAFSPRPKDGKYLLATASNSGTVKVWSSSGDSRGKCYSDNSLVAIAFSPTDANLLATASASNKLKILKIIDCK